MIWGIVAIPVSKREGTTTNCYATAINSHWIFCGTMNNS